MRSSLAAFCTIDNSVVILSVDEEFMIKSNIKAKYAMATTVSKIK